jgi:prevent-host-death family protein
MYVSQSAAEMPISEARDHLAELVGRARYSGAETILTHYGRPAAVLISFEHYQRLEQADAETPEYQLPPEIEAVVEESRRHPERDQPRPRRAGRRPR